NEIEDDTLTLARWLAALAGLVIVTANGIEQDAQLALVLQLGQAGECLLAELIAHALAEEQLQENALVALHLQQVVGGHVFEEEAGTDRGREGDRPAV